MDNNPANVQSKGIVVDCPVDLNRYNFNPEEHPGTMHITFEDHGQDFYEFVLDMRTSVIIDAIPFQRAIFAGCRCTNTSWRIGGRVSIQREGEEPIEIRYPIEGIDFRGKLMVFNHE